MKKLKLDQHEYGLAYMGVCSMPSKTEDQLETSVRLIRKLKAVGYEGELNDAEKRAKAQGMQFVFPNYVADNDVVLALQEDEHKLMHEKLKAYMPNVLGYAAEIYLSLLTKVKEATTVADVMSEAAG